MMLLASSLILAILQLSVSGSNTLNVTFASHDCADNCIECMNGSCLICHEHYHGEDCNLCKTHCENWDCGSRVCPLGCDDGWYRLRCDVPCPEKCPDRCGQFTGYCFHLDISPPYIPPSSCLEGVCKMGCEQYCNVEEHSDEKHTVLSTEQILMIGTASMTLMICCFCCVVKSRDKTVTVKTEAMEIVPFNQRLLPGQQPIIFASSNRTYLQTSLRNVDLDSDNVLMYASNSQACCSNEPRDVNSHFVTAEIPPPACGHGFGDVSDLPSPPSYGSLFKPTVSSSSDCVSPQ